MNTAVVFAKPVGVHLVRPHKLRPKLEGRRSIRALCGRGGTVVSETTRAIGVCIECRMIEAL
jgi:hypothetical protein